MSDPKTCSAHGAAKWFIPVIVAAAFAAVPLGARAMTQDAPPTPAASVVPHLAGVQVIVLDRKDWPGPARITRELTPVKVRIENNGSSPLLLTYDRFKLRDANGRIYRALPLFKVEGTDPSSLKVSDPYLLGTQHFVLKNFKMAPYYRGIYRIELYEGSFATNPAYYKLYDSYYSGKPLPTTGMRRRGIPEGVILPGGIIEGFLFFEEVDGSTDGSLVIYEAADAATGSSLGQIRSTG